MGFGPYEQRIREFAEKYENIHFLAAVSQQKIPLYTGSADVGICLFENICLSHYYVLPNKFFEYTLSGLAVIASDFPDLSREIKNLGNGWNVKVNKRKLTELVNKLTMKDIEAKKEKSRSCRKSIGWHKEEVVLVSIYNKLLMNQDQVK